MKKLCLCLLLSLLCTACACTGPDTPQAPGASDAMLHTAFLSVGKADAALIYTEGLAILIDTGEDPDATAVLGFLQAHGIQQLDLLILSHYDKDHIGGAAAILEEFPVQAVYAASPVKESDAMDRYTAALASRGITPHIVQQKTVLSIGTLSLTLLPPDSLSYAEKTSNNTSLVVRAVYGDTAMLFAGDIQEARIKELLQSGEDISCDLLKVPYHGNNIDNLAAFLAASAPSYGIVTCSEEEPLKSGKRADLRAAGVQIYQTVDGTVLSQSDGKTWTITQQEAT